LMKQIKCMFNIYMIAESVLIAVVAGVVTVVCLLIRACYMSKCRTVQIGCVKIERDTINEQSVRNLEK